MVLRKSLIQLRSKVPVVIGMVHVGPLPVSVIISLTSGTANFKRPLESVVKAACEDAEIYRDCGLDGVLVENYHDLPWLRASQVGSEVTASMTRICSEIRCLCANMLCGVQILAGANKQALAVAQASEFDFVRVEAFVFSHVADEGWMDACAGELLRFRRTISAGNIKIFTDIKKKHCSHSVTSDTSEVQTAKAAEFFLSDGVILTGESTGLPAKTSTLKEIAASVKIPAIVGSGITVDNLEAYLCADAFIVGSHFKERGLCENGIEKMRVLNFMKKIKQLES